MKLKFKAIITILMTISFVICFVTGIFGMGYKEIHGIMAYFVLLFTIIHIFSHMLLIKSFILEK